jgi:hypothetical protein
MPLRTRGGKKTALGDVEGKLKREYPGNPGAVYAAARAIPFKQLATCVLRDVHKAM